MTGYVKHPRPESTNEEFIVLAILLGPLAGLVLGVRWLCRSPHEKRARMTPDVRAVAQRAEAMAAAQAEARSASRPSSTTSSSSVPAGTSSDSRRSGRNE